MGVPLRDYGRLPNQYRFVKQVRFLEVDGRSDAIAFVEDLRRSSDKEFKKLIKLLKRKASSTDIPALDTIKRVGSHKSIFQLDGFKNARFYCFEYMNQIIVCLSGF